MARAQGEQCQVSCTYIHAPQDPSLPSDIPYPQCHCAGAVTHLTLVHRPLLGAGRVVAPLAPRGVSVLGGSPPLRAALAALCLSLAELQAELLILLLHPAHPRGQRLPLRIPHRLLAQTRRQQEEAAICGRDRGMQRARQGQESPGVNSGAEPQLTGPSTPLKCPPNISALISRDVPGDVPKSDAPAVTCMARATPSSPNPALPTLCCGLFLDLRRTRRTHSHSRLPTKR